MKTTFIFGWLSSMTLLWYLKEVVCLFTIVIDLTNQNTQRQRREMGEVKHILVAKFKDGISQEQIDNLIKGYANLVNHVEPMKSFLWGKDVSIENMHQGLTRVFEALKPLKTLQLMYLIQPMSSLRLVFSGN